VERTSADEEIRLGILASEERREHQLVRRTSASEQRREHQLSACEEKREYKLSADAERREHQLLRRSGWEFQLVRRGGNISW
jgi:hypothetical protein